MLCHSCQGILEFGGDSYGTFITVFCCGVAKHTGLCSGPSALRSDFGRGKRKMKSTTDCKSPYVFKIRTEIPYILVKHKVVSTSLVEHKAMTDVVAWFSFLVACNFSSSVYDGVNCPESWGKIVQAGTADV